MYPLRRIAFGVTVVAGSFALVPGVAFAALDDQGNPIVADDGMAVITADEGEPAEILPGLDGVDPAVQTGVVLEGDEQPQPVNAPVEAVEPRTISAPGGDHSGDLAPLVAAAAVIAVVGAGGVVLVRRRQHTPTPA